MTKLKKVLPGLFFTAVLAVISIKIQNIDFIAKLHFSSLIIAILLGVLINNIIKIPAVFKEGIIFSLKKVLRLAIILLGFRLSLTEVMSVGGKGLLLVTIVTTVTLIFAIWIGKKLKMNESLSLLIGVGTSICGASAVAAVAPAIEAEEKDTSFAIATVTLFGTAAMFIYPMVYKFLHLPSLLYAVWTGASVHEVAQVVGAGFAAGSQAGQFATIVKLTRVLLVIPAAIILGFRHVKKENSGSWNIKNITIPWFVFGFLAVVVINSIDIIPSTIETSLVTIDGFLLTLAMAGMGLETSIEKMKKVGLKPFYAGLAVWIFIGTFGFTIANLLF